MGKLEDEARKRRKLGAVQQAMLLSIGLAGIMTVAMIAPNALQLLGRVPNNKYGFRNYSARILSQLASSGDIVFEERRGRQCARITESGKRTLAMRGFMLLDQLGKRKRWDRRWRVIVFDIPEKFRATRDTLRALMHRFGFYQLQQSVWIYPHDCEDVMALVKARLKLGSSVRYMIVEKIENDRDVKDYFGNSSLP